MGERSTTPKPGFFCPKCGGRLFGTSNMDKPPAEWIVHCHSPLCGWEGLHCEHVFPVRLSAGELVKRGFSAGDAEKVEDFARRLFWGTDR